MPAKKVSETEELKPNFLPEPEAMKRPWYSVRREFVIALIVAVAFYVVVWALV
jgi:hypothetical protein